jgi:monofunctional glycosyltransferase
MSFALSIAGFYAMLRFVWKIIKRILLIFFISSIAGVLLFRFVPVPFTPLMIIRLVEQWQDGSSLRLDKSWRPLDEISPHVPLAMLAAEDQKFLEHHGFDFEAIKKTWKKNAKSKRVPGASTISQQTAKNVFLWPSRSWIRKGFEAYFTVLIELLWSKQRIMEVYVNVIEMGNGVYGIEAAAQEYYKKSAAKLNRGEAAMIACILPNPRKFSPLRPSNRIFLKHQRVMKSMNMLQWPRAK